jgi:type IV pilus assembly protein PilC
MDDFQQFSSPEPGAVIVGFVLYILLGLLPASAATYVIYFLLTLPMRRNQRARAFIDLLEYGLKAGRSPESVIVDASASRERSFGVRFHLLAAYIQDGLRLSAALDKVPRFLPPQVVSTIKMGERTGNITTVLPACRHLLRDAVSQVRGAINYLVLFAFVLTPFSLVVPIVFRIQILPKYKQVFEGLLEGARLPAFSRFVFGEGGLFTQIQLVLVAFIWVAALVYIGGPALVGWINRLLPGLPGALAIRLPWQRKRLQRDFSSMLALLLDHGVPETEAVNLAAESTANSSIQKRARQAQERLKQGAGLPEALQAMDDCGEFQWRLRNALKHHNGFMRALKGWHEALEAKAFQLEQTSAQIITTVLVIINGLVIGSISIAIFLALVQVINSAILW